MEPILTPAEMAEADQRTIAAGTPVDVLMERAGTAVAWAVRQHLGATYAKRAVMVCGKGNNGGDGLLAARVLEGWGVRVDVVRLVDGVPAAALDRKLARADVLIDAMFGTGFRGALEGDAAQVAERSAHIPTVSVDIPSGVDGATGATAGPAVRAVATVTFAARKTGLCFEPGRSLAGEITVADIGIDLVATGLDLIQQSDVVSWLAPVPPETNKWKSALLVVGGSDGMTGAPLMVSHAAMRVGAGIVWCGVPGHDAARTASGSEVVAKALPATKDGGLAGISDEVQGALDRFRAAAVGPGLGRADETIAAVRELVLGVPVPLVLDADGLNAFAGAPEALRDRHAATVLTPHEGEYERLMGAPVGDDRVAAARQLAEASGCVALLKGPGTVIAEPTGSKRTAINPVDGPWLGTAGSGDVLTGIIGGLLARGLEPFEAAASGAFLHGRAADTAGHTGLVAGDLVTALPRTLDDITSQEP
jgi:ADP-dependent NAD(P)H-hydrate dehydratase / NAD(P)H-hydrate epimerase